MFWTRIGQVGALCALFVACAPSGNAPRFRVEVRDHAPSSRLRVSVTRNLEADETLHVRIRNGRVGELDCRSMAAGIDRIEDDEVSDRFPHGPTFEGPRYENHMFEDYLDASWLTAEEPTAEMLAAVENAFWTIDVCIMKDGVLVHQEEMDARRALDRAGDDGKFDGEEEERIGSSVAYAELCETPVDQGGLGDNPFFPRIGEGDYETFDCLDATPIPTTVTDAEGNVEHPETWPSQCDHPQYIYSHCEANAVPGRSNGPRVAHRSNEDGTHFVLLCRKSGRMDRGDAEGFYNDIAMIGHNPFTGRTCFYQNQLQTQYDGTRIPHPADTVRSEQSPEQAEILWGRSPQGGVGNGIECAGCHDADPFIHSPWIDGALDEAGNPVVPRMGIDEDFVVGNNSAPYTLINAHGQGWTVPQTLVSEEAAACTRCHRMNAGKWLGTRVGGFSGNWLNRLVGQDTAWTNKTTEAYRSFEHVFWMPPDHQGLDWDTWEDSEYGQAVAFLQRCGSNPDDPACIWQDNPSEQILDVGELPTVELEGAELALEALKILGGPVNDPEDPRCDGPEGSCETRRCAECHSVSRSGMDFWLERTEYALSTCGLERDPESMTAEEARAAVDCLRVDPDDPASVFAAEQLGVLTTGVRFGQFRQLFRRAYEGGPWLREYIRFRNRVSMPKGNHPAFTQMEYAVVRKWFEQRLPNIADVIREVPPPEVCEPHHNGTFLSGHIDEMRFEGWEAINRDDPSIHMFGCAPGQSGTECLTDLPTRSEWSAGVGTLRELTQLSFRTSFWTRSSADGRFVGNGGRGGTSGGSTITDLGRVGSDSRPLNIGISGSYDPGFFPDNSGFMMQGGGAGICDQNVLLSHDAITFEEEGCMRASGINLYQHVARGLNGGDYFIINSQFTSDAGGGSDDPRASFNASSTMKFTPMIFNGTTYEQQLENTIVDSPYEGDSVLSPSGQLVISRLAGPGGRGIGYVIRQVVAEKRATGYHIGITDPRHGPRGEVATICAPGAKANISFDERFVVTHHYENGTSNIYLVDLADPTGRARQITDMPDGTRALFPHFRSDGWFYFLVKDGSSEYVVASDAALTLRAGGAR